MNIIINTTQIQMKACFMAFVLFLLAAYVSAQVVTPKNDPTPRRVAAPDTEDDFYRMFTLPVPENIILEVGGMTTMSDGNLMVCTRRGEVWIISNPYVTGFERPVFKRFAYGLHEPLGLDIKGDDVYVTQRSEITRLRDNDKDGQADSYDKIYAWPLSGNYHEYSYGPLFLPNGNMMVTLNLGWSNSLGHGVSLAPWRGWMLEITPDGKMMPYAAGLRSPAGYAFNSEGDIFYSENQGDWVGSGRITHLEKGDFAGNAEGLKWSSLAGSPVHLKPSDIPNTGRPLYDISREVKGLKPPAVWLPHGIFGISTSGMLSDNTNGKFGPFKNQLFVGDQGESKIMRVDLEKVKGVYQGVVFAFREGFSSGILRLSWGHDGSQFVGMTSRGWSSTGKMMYSLQRLVWTGKMPFEMQTIRAMPDGFEITFTNPVDKKIAEDPASYKVTGFNYKYHSTYGSPVINDANCPIRGVVVSADSMKARLVVDSLRLGYIHEIVAEGVRSNKGKALLHNTGYYTLNNLPDGEKLKIESVKHDHKEMVHAVPVPPKAVKKIEQPAKEKVVNKHVTQKPSSWKQPDYTINMTTKPGLKFSPDKFEVKAGSKVKVIFSNDDDMLHNFVVVMPGSAIEVGELGLKLGLQGQQKNYIAVTPKILYHTVLLAPHTSEEIYFTAPSTPGDYMYVCTVPGHFYSMQGIMKVVK